MIRKVSPLLIIDKAFGCYTQPHRLLKDEERSKQEKIRKCLTNEEVKGEKKYRGEREKCEFLKNGEWNREERKDKKKKWGNRYDDYPQELKCISPELKYRSLNKGRSLNIET